MAIFRRLKPARLWSDPAIPERYENFSMKFTFRGKQILRDTFTPVKSEALKFEARVRRELAGDHSREMWDALEKMKARKVTGDRMEELFAAWENGWTTVRQAGAVKECRRCLNELLRVLAYAHDLWTTVDQGRYRMRHTVRVPDRERIGALPTSALNGETVRAYLRKRSEEECGSASWAEARPEHLRINSMVRNARDMLRAKAWAHLYEPAGLVKPAKLEDFMKFDLLKQIEGEPEPLSAEEFDRMVAAAGDLELSTDVMQREVALVNALMRSTGLRSGSVELARSDWLEKRHDGWWLVVRSVKSGTRKYDVPITDALAARFTDRVKENEGMKSPRGEFIPCFLILPHGTAAQRAEVVDKLHNRFLKATLGTAGRGQGNHRLRDTVAAVCRSWLTLDIAVEMLGHEDERTTRKHYARVRQDISDTMKRELDAARRLQGKIVPFEAAA